jgi:hypothetical protein
LAKEAEDAKMVPDSMADYEKAKLKTDKERESNSIVDDEYMEKYMNTDLALTQSQFVVEEDSDEDLDKMDPSNVLRDVCCVLAAGCWLLAAVCCLLSAVCCLQPAACCLRPAVCCLLYTVCCLLWLRRSVTSTWNRWTRVMQPIMHACLHCV